MNSRPLPYHGSALPLSYQGVTTALANVLRNIITSRGMANPRDGVQAFRLPLNVVGREERERVNRFVVDMDLEVKVRTGGHTRITHEAENLAELDVLTNLNLD